MFGILKKCIQRNKVTTCVSVRALRLCAGYIDIVRRVDHCFDFAEHYNDRTSLILFRQSVFIVVVGIFAAVAVFVVVAVAGIGNSTGNRLPRTDF